MSTVPSAATVSRLEKVAVDNGFDRELDREGGWLCFARSQAPVRLRLTRRPPGLRCQRAALVR